MTAAARKVPPRLAVLLAIALVEGIVWCIVLPPLQGPDEISHFSYVQKIAETGSIPWTSAEPAKAVAAYSTEVEVANECSGLTGLAQNLSAQAPASVLDERICSEDLKRLPPGAGSNGGFTSADKNPPLYYLYETVPYLAASSGSFFTRSLVMRLANVPLLLVLVIFTWLLAGELLVSLPRGPSLRTLATVAVVLNPQLTMMTATINPDIPLAALWAAGLWFSVAIVRRGPTRSRIAWLVAVCVMAGFTQGRGLPLILPAAAALVIAAWRRRPPKRYAAAASVAAIVVVVLAGAYLLLRYALNDQVTIARAREFLSYIWQFYLPKLSFMQPTIHPGYGVRQVFVERFFGTFAQLETTFSPAMMEFLTRATEVVALAVVVGLIVHWRRLFKAPWTVFVLVAAALGYMVMLHVVAFSSLLTLSTDPIITGRYLLPLIGLYGVGIAVAVSWLPRLLSAVLSGAVTAGLVALQLGALAILLVRFYA